MFFLFSNVIHTFVKLQIFTEITVKKLRFIYYTSLYILYVIQGVPKPPKLGVSEDPPKRGFLTPLLDPPLTRGVKKGSKGVKIPPFWTPPGSPPGGATFLRQILGAFWDPPRGGSLGGLKRALFDPPKWPKNTLFDPFWTPPGTPKTPKNGCFFGPPQDPPKTPKKGCFLGSPKITILVFGGSIFSSFATPRETGVSPGPLANREKQVSVVWRESGVGGGVVEVRSGLIRVTK